MHLGKLSERVISLEKILSLHAPFEEIQKRINNGPSSIGLETKLKARQSIASKLLECIDANANTQDIKKILEVEFEIILGLKIEAEVMDKIILDIKNFEK